MSNRYLPTTLRRALEKAIKEARIVAEEGARDAIRRLGVADGKAPGYLNDSEKELRRRLRAHARALGDEFDRGTEAQQTKHLIEGAAYAHWHRMLFARFLAERGLLRHPEHDVAVTLEDCRELAADEGLSDAWALAERYAASMLPAVFRIDDPVLALDLDPVHTQKLHQLVTGLDAEVFQAEDSLGWTYQFWRASEKDAVNASGVKIGADELPAVTQLFTEPYMVRFLLHNTLGAWWAGKVLAADPTAQTAQDEDALRAACSLPKYAFDMLRFVREGEDGPWSPAAGTFSGWPKDAKAITMLDPCCGSGHFLTEALAILAAMRQAEEHLSSEDAVAAVLRDNLHGLEIDGRCVQIAAFAVALSAWRIGGWQTLPLPQIAWVGAPPPLPRREFIALAEGDTELEYALCALHDLFVQAPFLGTLIEPSGGDLFESEKLSEVERLLVPLIVKAKKAEPEITEGATAARGMADAAAMLHRKYVFQATNVPFLGRSKQFVTLSKYIDQRFPRANSDLGTAMFSRLTALSEIHGTLCCVLPQGWLFQPAYEELRRDTIHRSKIDLIAYLGAGAFGSSSAAGGFSSMCVISNTKDANGRYRYFDTSSEIDPETKSRKLTFGSFSTFQQAERLTVPAARLIGDVSNKRPLSAAAKATEGASTGDSERFARLFWELTQMSDEWELVERVGDREGFSSEKQEYVRWRGPNGIEAYSDGARIRGHSAWNKKGILIARVGSLRAKIYSGGKFDKSCIVIVPHNESMLPQLSRFCMSESFYKVVRSIDKKIYVTTSVFDQIPFDPSDWEDGADGLIFQEAYEDPSSVDFVGHPAAAETGAQLHVALARLVGYQWPAENGPNMGRSDAARGWLDKAAALPPGDNDGLLGVSAVAGEKPLADRLRAYLASTFGTEWSDDMERRLIVEADQLLDKRTVRDVSLESWVRERAFRQHCALFVQRPFLWQISDGLKDGFSVFVHYQRFDQGNLRKLTYTLLGDWLARAKAENNDLRYEKGRELQQKLEKVLEGEKPYDIFVRWKSLAQQPLGWDPDLDDGVRQNIRPFIMAGVLTHDLSKILKNKDRGTDVASAPWYDVFNGERRNDHHTTLAEKRAARDAGARRVGAAQ